MGKQFSGISRPISSKGRVLLVSVAGLLLTGGALQAVLTTAQPSSATTPVAVALVGNTAPVPHGDVPDGTPSLETSLNLEVNLQPRDPAALTAAVQAVSSPSSPDYQHYLAPGQFAQIFGPTSSTISAVTAVLESEGLTVGSVSATGLSLPITGTVAQIEAAFATTLSQYTLPDGSSGYINTAAPSVPSTVAPDIEGIEGLDTLVRPQSNAILAAPSTTSERLVTPSASVSPATSAPDPITSSTGCTTVGTNNHSFLNAHQAGTMSADQLANAYSLNSLYNGNAFGQNTSIALVEPDASGYNPTDISTFASCYGITIGSNQISPVDVSSGVTGNPTSGELDESELDIETALSLAPSANIQVYIGSNGPNNTTPDSLLNIFQKIVSMDTSKIVSASWTNGCENYLTTNYQTTEATTFSAAAMQGQTIFVSSGDQGSEGCNVNGIDGAATSPLSSTTAQDVDPISHTLYLASQSNEVSVIDDNPAGSDANSFLQRAQAPTSNGPDAVLVDSGDSRVFVADGTGNALTEFSTTNCNATTFSGCGSTSTITNVAGDLQDPVALALDSANSTLYVANATNHFVSLFNSTNNQPEGTISLPTGATPTAITLGEGHTIYVTDKTNNVVDYFDGSTCNASVQTGCSTTPSTISVGTNPVGLVYESTNADLYVLKGAGGVSVISTTSKTLLSTIATSGFPKFATVSSAQSIGLSPDGSKVLVVIRESFPGSALVTIDPSSQSVTGVVGLETSNTLGGLVSDSRQNLVWIVDPNQGISIDQDLSLGIQDPPNQPDITAVGGTSVASIGPAPSESVWNDNQHESEGAGGGGISKTFNMPSYQVPVAVITDSSGTPCGNVSGDCREIPDVSADADPSTGYVTFITTSDAGGWNVFGGTSASAPLWAATLAVIESVNGNTSGYGLFNSKLYALAASSSSSYFNDVTAGNNDYNATNSNSFSAHSGYDIATGLGTPIASGIAGGTSTAGDGSGSLTVLPAGVSASATAQTLVFTYSPGSGGAANGSLTLNVPTGWSSPSLTSSSPGYTTSTCGTVSVSGTTITVNSLIVAPSTNCTITYGSKLSSGPGASVPSSVTTSTFSTTQKSTPSGTLTALTASPSVVVANVPSAPTAVTATAATLSASVNWSAPSGNGSNIVSYTVTAHDATTPGNGGETCVASSPTTTCTVTGLTANDSYTFTVTATNAVGTGSASTASNAVLPTAAITGGGGGGGGGGGSSTTTTTTTPVQTAPSTAPAPTGVSAASFGTPTSGTAQSDSTTAVSSSVSGASTTVSVPAGALPAGTTVSVYPVTNTTSLSSMLTTGSYIVSFAVSWVAPDGSSPNATSPISMTISNSSIAAGDSIYEVTAAGLVKIGTATAAGTVTITFLNDPIFVIAAPPVSVVTPVVAPVASSPTRTVVTKKPKITITSSKVTLTGRTLVAPVTLSCSTAACSGTVELVETVTTKQMVKVKSGNKTVTKTVTKTTTVVLASASYKLAVGKSQSFNLTLTAAGKNALKTVAKKPLKETIATTVKSGTAASKAVTIS